jgi:hypothetical protein
VCIEGATPTTVLCPPVCIEINPPPQPTVALPTAVPTLNIPSLCPSVCP